MGSNYFEACQVAASPDGQAAAEGIRQVMAGELCQYDQIYPCHSPQEHRWFQLRVTPFADAPFVLVIHENVTVLQTAQQQARRTRR